MGAAVLAASVSFGLAGSPAARSARPRGVRLDASHALPRVVFTPQTPGGLLVHGTYPRSRSRCRGDHTPPPLHVRLAGTVEVGREPDGRLFVVNVLPFETYLQGLGEVPASWPMAALEAQAVAARSYALANLAYPDPTGRSLGYQICATAACQVYEGLGISNGAFGSRWVRAVRATHGLALTYQGRPADTVYFSTSDGRTYSNAAVFGSAPLPYLRPVVERDDGASPLSHWRVAIPVNDLARFLVAAGVWRRGVPVRAATGGGDRPVVVAGGGRRARLDPATFADDVSAWSVCLDPGRYPPDNTSSAASAGGRLPETVPSRWFTATTAGDRVVLTGRGWGHGVGMVQWGARGRAARGWSYRRILAYYYGGLSPRPVHEPATIRVGVAVGLASVTIAGSGQVNVAGAPGAPGAGPWTIASRGGRLTVGSGHAPAPELRAGPIRAPATARPGQTIAVSVPLTTPAVVRLVLGAPGGRTLDLGPPASFGAGAARLERRLPSLEPGTYSLRAEVSDGIDAITTDAVALRVGTAATPSAGGAPTAPPADAWWWGTALAALAIVAALLSRRRRPRRPASS